MYSNQNPLILDNNNIHSLFTLPCYRFSNSKLLVYTEFNTMITSFTDYIRFIIDQLHSSTQYDMTFFSNDSSLYAAAKEVEPVLATLEKVMPHIINPKESKIDNNSKIIRDRLENYLDSVGKNIELGYKILDLYYDYLVSIAQIQVIYCYTILKKNKKASSSSSARPFKVMPFVGNTLNSMNEDKKITDIEFLVEIRNAPLLKKSIPYTILQDYPYGDLIKEAIKVTLTQQDGNDKVIIPNIISYIEETLENLPKSVAKNISSILDNACYILVIAEAVKRDKVMYVLEDSITI